MVPAPAKAGTRGRPDKHGRCFGDLCPLTPRNAVDRFLEILDRIPLGDRDAAEDRPVAKKRALTAWDTTDANKWL